MKLLDAVFQCTTAVYHRTRPDHPFSDAATDLLVGGGMSGGGGGGGSGEAAAMVAAATMAGIKAVVKFAHVAMQACVFVSSLVSSSSWSTK